MRTDAQNDSLHSRMTVAHAHTHAARLGRDQPGPPASLRFRIGFTGVVWRHDDRARTATKPGRDRCFEHDGLHAWRHDQPQPRLINKDLHTGGKA